MPDIAELSSGNFTVTLDEGRKISVIVNNFGQVILMDSTTHAFGQLEPEMLEALLHLAKEERL
jgi:hypothetical protein